MATRLKIEGDRVVRKNLGDLKSAVQNPGPHLEKARPSWEASIKRNFRAGGRPEKWPAKVDGTPSNLVGKTGLLVGGINSKVVGKTIEIRSPRIYSSAHNFGGTITFKTRPISIQMPKREFMIVPEDEQERNTRITAESMAREANIK